MGASVKPEPVDPIAAYKAKYGTPAPAAADPIAAYKAKYGAQAQADQQARTKSDGSEAAAGVVPSALDALTFGLSRKLIAGGNAAVAALKEGVQHPSENLAPIAGRVYQKDLSAQDAAAQQYHAAHPYLDTAAQVAGGLGNVALTGGLGAGSDALNAGRLARWGTALKTGAKYGALNAAGHSEALEQGRGVTGLGNDAVKGGAEGLVGGALSIPATAIAGKVIGATPLPRMLSAGAGKLAQLAPEGSGVQRDLTAMSGAFGPDGAASQVIAKRAAMDASGGFTPNDLPKSVTLPAMALDRAGPNVEGLAEGIANKPGAGRATIVQALDSRAKQMRPALAGALEQGTGVAPNAGLTPLEEAVATRSAADNQNFPAAFEATKGELVNSPTLDKIVRTPTGKKALAWAQARQANLLPDAPELQPDFAKLNGMSPDQWDLLRSAAEARGVPLPEGPAAAAAGYTPQTVHLMKRYLAGTAKLGLQDGQQGMASAEAHGAMSLWGKVRDELPAAVRDADAVSAQNAKVVNATNQGRQIFRTPINPSTANAGKAVNSSLGALDARMAAASPEEQAALQRGAGAAAQARLQSAPNSVKSPGRIFNQSPEQAAQLAHAFPSPEQAQAFQQEVSAWDRAQQQAERLTGNSRTALRGNEAGDQGTVRAGDVFARSPRMVLRRIANSISDEYEAGKQQALDSRIAQILTSPNHGAIDDAAAAGASRAQMLQALHRLAAALSGDQGGQRAVKP